MWMHRVFHEKRITEATDLTFLLKLKQGQVEVEQAAVVTDYTHSSLLHRREIEELNTEIRKLGGEKVQLLIDTKNTKKLIKKKKWENKRLDMFAEDLKERTKYFQLLRVTKHLQALIKGGAEDLHAAELSTLEKRAKHSEKVTTSFMCAITLTLCYSHMNRRSVRRGNLLLNWSDLLQRRKWRMQN